MTMKKDKMNIEKKSMIDLLNKTSKDKKKDIYARVAEILNTPKRRSVKVNLAKIQSQKVVVDGGIIVIPGKILGTGVLTKKVIIYAYNVSESAKTKFKSIKTLKEFCKDTIDYKKTIIIK